MVFAMNLDLQYPDLSVLIRSVLGMSLQHPELLAIWMRPLGIRLPARAP